MRKMTTGAGSGKRHSEALGVDVAAAIAGYTPRQIPPARWAEIRELVQQAVTAVRPPSPATAYTYLRVAARYADWCASQGIDVAAERMFTEANVEWFIATAAPTFLAKSSLPSYRSALRRIGRAATRRALWEPIPRELRLKKHGAMPPYSPTDMARFLAAAPLQPSPERRRACSALLALAYGAGLSSAELIACRAVDVESRGGGYVVVVRGNNAREVPALAKVDSLLQWLVDQFPEGPLLTDRNPKARSTFSGVVGRVELPPGAPPLDLRRLRTTWLAEILASDLRVSEVLKLSGLRNSQKFAELAPYVTMRDFETVHRLVRSAGRHA
ncbi:hypothetical protein KZX45_16245 [Georgenia sp. EYE_87]|uniref:hypothetical protein n=1 Tax=Georgenia sp. EYE_87 TaxID=2853448 RepID=UPI002003CC03|nr:hypothetical protein [Georgenia sp. EYE_87]MCK6212095.1 hypothetical protein [Georgenia sp. EYE_87]